MTADFRQGLESIAATDRASMRAVVEQKEARLYAHDWPESTRSNELVDAVPPSDLLRGQVTTPDDVARAIDQVEASWRLDAIMALVDYLD